MVGAEGNDPSSRAFQTLANPSQLDSHMEEIQRFELWEPLGSMVFRTIAIDHSAISPYMAPYERLELPTPAFVVLCSTPTELTGHYSQL